MAHNDGLLKWLGWLRKEAMQGPFLGPFAHLALDDTGVDPVAPWLDHFLGNLLHQQVVPAGQPAFAGRTLGQATAQDFQRRGKRQSPRVQVLSGGRFVHQHPHQIVCQQQAIDLLDHTGRGLAAEHWAFALMGLELINAQFFLPTLVVETDQGRGRIELGIEQGGQQPMPLAGPGASRVVERVL